MKKLTKKKKAIKIMELYTSMFEKIDKIFKKAMKKL